MTVPQGSLASTPEPIRIATAEIGGNGYAFVTDTANNQVVEFTINPSTGLLSEATWASPDGASYPTGAAATGSGPIGLAVNTDPVNNSDDPYLYVAAGNVDEYDITPGTGALSSAVSVNDTTGAYAGGDASAMAIAPDGNELYVGNDGPAFISLFTVAADGTLSADATPTFASGTSPTTPAAGSLPSAGTPVTPVAGTLTQSSPNDCITSDTFSSAQGPGCNYSGLQPPSGSMTDSYQPVVSPDGRFAYVVSLGGDLDEFSRNPSSGALTYLNCVSANSDCSGAANNNLNGMDGPQEMAISPDGTSAYVVTSGGSDGNALVEFTRSPSTGLLSYQGCFSSSSDDSTCTSSVGIDNPYGVTVSPDGTSVYVTSNTDSSIIEFSRSGNSPLTEQGCITTDTTNPGGCGTVDGGADLSDLDVPLSVQVSPDDRDVYVAGGGLGPGGDVVEFTRGSQGLLTLGIDGNTCITTGGTGPFVNCTTTNAIGFDGGSEDLAISPDGENVYVNAFGDNGVIELARDTTTGVLTQLAPPNACIAEETSTAGSPFSCFQPPYPQRHGTAGALGVAVSPDGLNVYVSGSADNAVDSFSRDPQSDGALTPLPFADGCITSGPQYVAGTCPLYNANGLFQTRRLVVSPDGGSVYVVNQGGLNVGGTQYGGDGVAELARTTPVADLSVTASAPASATLGGEFSYTLRVTDNGPSDEYDASLSNALPSDVTFSSVSASQGSCAGAAMLSCSLGWLTNGSSATITVTVTAASTGTATDAASVAQAGDVSDPNGSNNAALASTTISAPMGSSVAPPVLDQSTDLAPVSGTVLVELPGSTTFVPVSAAENIPMGSTINATSGTVQITVALPNGTTETGQFYDGEFVVTQDATGRVFETLTGGSFAGCPAPGKASKHKHALVELAGAKKKATTVVRQLWGNAHGDFTTKGRYGSAAVSGTIWLTQDLCEGTYFRVTKDTIVVTANAHPSKHHNLKQGQSYLVLAPGF